ncbi:MAG TPA: cytochrome c [Chloroflexota bacterium]|nr:cytochrome c [Chloroflexota bacterium]
MRGNGSGWRLSALGLLAAGCWLVLAGLPARAYTPEQVAAGRDVYARSCASCHGARGEGGGPESPDAPLLVGPRALTGFRDALELYEFTAESMPQDQPNSLPAEEYWAVIAWLLAENGLSGPGEPLGPANAAQVSLRR